MKKPRLTIHKIAQVDRICAVPDLGLVHPSLRRRVVAWRFYHGYMAAWLLLVENNAHQS